MEDQVLEATEITEGVSTVNVVQLVNGDLNSIVSFYDNETGNAEAEREFSDLLESNGVDKDDIDSYIDEGSWTNPSGDYQVLLAHSC